LRARSPEPRAPDADRATLEQDFDAAVARHLRWNFFTNMVYGLFGTTGWRIVFTPTFVPAYAFAITGSEFMVGLLSFLTGVLRLLGPFAATAMIEHRRRVKPLAIVFGMSMRIQLVFVAAAALWLYSEHASWNVLAFFVAMPLCHGFSAMQSVAYGMVMSKVIPPLGRGIYNRNLFVGFRNALGGVTAIALIAWARDALAGLGFPTDFAYLLLAGFALTCMGLLFFSFTREPDSPVVAQRESMARKVVEIPTTLRQNPNFASFVLARALASLGSLALPFYILHARTLLAGVPGIEVNMTLYWMAAACMADPLWGMMAWRSGYRRVYLVSMALWIAASAVFVFASGELPIAFAFAAVAAANAGFNSASANMVFEFSDSDLRPRMIATSSTLGDVAATVAALGGGWLAEVAPLPVLFSVAAVFLAGSAGIMARRVVEPRSPSLDEALRAETPGQHEVEE
jgi:MFS family permease